MKKLVLAALLSQLFLVGCTTFPQLNSDSRYRFSHNTGSRSIDLLDINDFTNAKLTAESSAYLNVSAKELYDYISDIRKWPEWGPVSNADYIHSDSNFVGANWYFVFREKKIELSTKHLNGEGKIKLFGYAITDDSSMKMPFDDHFGLFVIEDTGKGGALISYQLYFSPIGLKGVLAPVMMQWSIDDALDNMVQKFGGTRLES